MKRVSLKTKIDWLLDNQDVWEGFPKDESDTPAVFKTQRRKIVDAMKKARLFSERTLPADVNLYQLIGRAREVRRMSQPEVRAALANN